MTRLAFLAVALILGLHLAAAADSRPTLYVAPDGNDSWSGTLAAPNRAGTDGPFATPDRARDEVRKLRAAGKASGGVSVLFRQGIYHLSAPLTFGPEDSGEANAEVVYAPYRGERVSFQGSAPISGWRLYRDHIWQADLTGAPASGRFWQLFYRGKRQTLARYPNVDPQHPRSGGFRYVAGVVERGSRTLLQYDPARLDPARWAKPSEVRVHVWAWLNWNQDICPVQSVDAQRHVLTLAQPARYMLSEGNRYFVENALEELDSPGEWYCDASAKRLYFWPPDGTNPDGQVSVPVLPRLVQFQGDTAGGRFVHHVRLEHIGLSQTHESLVTISQASDCSIIGCTLTGCGATALTMADHSHHNRIAGCDISHVSGPAIEMNGPVVWSHNPEGQMAYNVIDNNHISDIGDGGDAWGAICLWPGCGGNATHDNVVSHNLIHDTPRQGVTFNGFHNIVEYNHVHHTNQEQSDTGAIGMGSRDIYERGSIVRYNTIHDTGGYNMLKPGVWEYPHYCWGVYLDDYTSGVLVYGNLIVRAQRGGVMVHGGQDNTIENNIIVDSSAQQVEYMPIDDMVLGRTPTHPDKSLWLMTGTRTLRNIFYYTDPKAKWVSGSKWKQMLAASERNLIWHAGHPVTMNLQDVASGDYWAAWRKMGYDQHSIIADPRFVDPGKGDYRLRPDSPAARIGFKPLPLDKMGLYRSPERASWPVADDQWREEHLRYPEGPPPAPVAHPNASVLKAHRVATAPHIDGCVDPPEWDWEAPGAKATIAALSLSTGDGKQPSYALVTYDNEALYVALINKVSDVKQLKTTGGTWGQDDGAEVCLQDASGKGPIFVIQGFPSGKWECVDHAGAPADAVRRLSAGVRYAATIGSDQWSGEWRIPFAGLGLDGSKVTSLRFNIGVLKAQENQWIAWVSTGAAPWNMDRAGKLELVR